MVLKTDFIIQYFQIRVVTLEIAYFVFLYQKKTQLSLAVLFLFFVYR